MKRPMKLLSMFTAASLAFSSFSAMAIPMTAYAAVPEAAETTVYKAETATTVAKGATLGVAFTYASVDITTDDVVAISFAADSVSTTTDDGKITLSETTTESTEASATLSVAADASLEAVTVHLVTKANGEEVFTDAKSQEITITAASSEEPEEHAYEVTVAPETATLNSENKSQDYEASVAKLEGDIPEGAEIAYEWEVDTEAQGNGAFVIPQDLTTKKITVKLNEDEENGAAAILASLNAELPEGADPITKFETTLTVTAKVTVESSLVDTVSATATLIYTEASEEEPSEEPSKPSQDEEKKDETKKDDTSKAPAPAGTEIKGEQATYKVTGAGEAEYEAPKDATASTVAIPDEIKDANGNVYKVTAVAPNAFKNNKKIKKATFGKNVTTIGANAFSGCKNLKNLELNGNVVKTIGKNAFKGTKKGLKVKIFAKNKKTAQKLFNKVVKKGKAKGAVLKFKKRK